MFGERHGKGARPGSIKQVRGAAYPPLTAPPARGRPPTPGSSSQPILQAASAAATSVCASCGFGASSSSAASAAAAAAGLPHGALDSSGSRSPSGAASHQAWNGGSARAIGSARTGGSANRTLSTRASSDTLGSYEGEPPQKPLSIESQREAKFDALLTEEVVDLKALRTLSWSGVPAHCRATVWPLLLGYLPPNKSFRSNTLHRKRRDYFESIPQYFDISDAERSEYQRKTLHQILIDVPRTSTSSAIFQCQLVQRALERVLYIWAIRHPASGYVQGINDMVTPFLLVFLSEHLHTDGPHQVEEVEELHREKPYLVAQAEADAFWCLSLLLDSVQDNYTFAQPGIQRMVFKLKELIARIDSKLHAHLLNENLHFIQFAFRWMNCLLLREFSLDLILRLWDTYLAEYGGSEDAAGVYTESFEIGGGFAVLHVYVCAALLTRWSAKLQSMEFQDLVIFLQHLPTSDWCITDMAELLSQAYVFKALYHNAPSHLSG